jgi:multidrug efflux pump subunit AcrA (membrane-fusion protein)
MSWINAKSLAAIAAAALLAGTAGYLAQKQKTDQLQARMDATLAQLEQAKAVNQAAQEALAARDQQLQKLQTATTELARTRNQVAQLQQQRDTAARSAPPPASPAPKPAALAAFPPGTYVNRAQLSFAGYASPEATIQSLAWAAVNGQSNIIPHVIPTDLEGGQELAQALQTALQDAGPAFTGMQILAEKVLADDRLEVLVKLDVQQVPGGSDNLPPPLNILPMVRVDNEWKLGGNPQNYSENWPTTGQIKTFAQ